MLQPAQTTRTTRPSDLSSRRKERLRPIEAANLSDKGLQAIGVKPEQFRRWFETADGQGNEVPLLLARFVNDNMVASLVKQDEWGHPLATPHIDFSKLGLQPAQAQFLEERYTTLQAEWGPDHQYRHNYFTKLVHDILTLQRFKAWQKQQHGMSNGIP